MTSATLGDILIPRFVAWSATLASRVRLVTSRLVLISLLPLDFHGRLRVIRSVFILGAFHGIEASFLADTCLGKLRITIFKVVWFRCQSLANVVAVLGLLDGPQGCDPAFCVVWFRSRMLRRYLAHRHGEVLRVSRLPGCVAEGCRGHAPVHLLVDSAAGAREVDGLTGWGGVALAGLRRWWRWDQSCGGFCSVPGPLQSVQRAEMWGVILALQTSCAVHLGVDNLGVVRHVGRLLDGHHAPIPYELVADGDLLLLIEKILHLRRLDTVQITKVKGHADQGVVLDGQVREVDRIGNDAADEAADFGRRRVGNAVIDACRSLSGVCGRWYPVIIDLHRFFIAIVRAVVNHDGGIGTAPDPLVWSAGARPKRRRPLCAVRIVLFCQGRLDSGTPTGLLFFFLVSVLRILLIGPTLLAFWLSGQRS